MLRRSLATEAERNKNKKKKKKDGGRPKPEDFSKDEEYELHRAIADAPRLRRPKFDQETYAKHAAIARLYNRNMRKLNDRVNGDLQLKIDIQQFAIDTLPLHMRAHATYIDDLPLPPLDRRMPTWTPPIPGFKPQDHLVDDD